MNRVVYDELFLDKIRVIEGGYYITGSKEELESINESIGGVGTIGEDYLVVVGPNAVDTLSCDGVYYGPKEILEAFDKPSSEDFSYCKLREDAVPPSKTRPSDSGYDLTILEKVKDVGRVELYSTGISVTPPNGYYFDMVPRSSIIKSGYILANSVGVIDRGYTGEILVPLIKVGEGSLELPSRVVQIIPRPIKHFNCKEVQAINSTVRGKKGFGSSGA